MVNQLEFMDCPHCGKRITTVARWCHHCKKAPSKTGQLAKFRTGDNESDGSHDESHMSLSGGYGNADDFDYDEFIEKEFRQKSRRFRPPSVKLWVWLTAWLLLIVLAWPLLLLVLQL